MVHIEKINVKGHTYYKLVHNIRKNGKVKSKSKYLGKTIPENIEERKQQFLQEIKSGKQDTPYKTILDTTPEVIYQAHPTTLKPTYITPAIQNLTGYTAQEWLANNNLWKTIIHKNDQKQALTTLQNIHTTNTTTATYRITTKNQENIWIQNTLTKQNNTIQGTLHNITTQHKATQKVQDLFQSNPLPMIEHDYSAIHQYLTQMNLHTAEAVLNHLQAYPDAYGNLINMVKIERVNTATLTFLKAHDKDHLLKIYHTKQFLRDSPQTFTDELITIAEGKKEFEQTTTIYSLDNTKHKTIIKWATTHPAYENIWFTFIDITAQKELQELINTKNFAIENSPSGIVSTDLLGTIQYTNTAFKKLTNIPTHEELEGKKIEPYLPHTPGAMKIFKTIHINKRWNGELTIPGDPDTNLKTEGVLVTDEYGDPQSIIFSFIDITELKTTENIRLEFTNIAAHELKTPIVPILTFLTMILDEPKKYAINTEGQKLLSICLRNTKRLNKLIQDILDISKLEAGGMKFVMETIDLLKIIQTEIVNNTAEAQQKNINIKAQLPDTLPPLHADPYRIAQVIDNFIRNAIHFTDQGNILVTATHHKDNIRVDILDTGAGISKHDQEKLFTKFYQAQDITTRRTKGTGLGLAISKKIITHHQGKVWAYSEGKNKGSTFSFTLPLHPKKQQEEERKQKRLLLGEQLLLGKTPTKTNIPPEKERKKPAKTKTIKRNTTKQQQKEKK
jgi:PAS domain S-box-containing protein